MNNEVATINTDLITNLVLTGDISKMNDVQKVQYYDQLCKSLNLNPATQPFQIIKFQGKEKLYATKDCTEQLRKLNGVSVIDMETKIEKDIIITKVKVQDKAGRIDISTGAVNIKNLSGDALANATMKSETKAKRRATLSICGLGMLDEAELDTMPKFETKSITNTDNPIIDIIKDEFKGNDYDPKSLSGRQTDNINVLTKEQAKAKLEALPQSIKYGFKALGYTANLVWEVCTEAKWDNHKITDVINADAEAAKKVSDTFDKTINDNVKLLKKDIFDNPDIPF
jgi:tRNA-binding EMAP/Myf-like protein